MCATKSLSHHGYSDARLSMNGSARLAQFAMGSACLIGNAYKVKGIRHQEERRNKIEKALARFSVERALNADEILECILHRYSAAEEIRFVGSFVDFLVGCQLGT